MAKKNEVELTPDDYSEESGKKAKKQKAPKAKKANAFHVLEVCGKLIRDAPRKMLNNIIYARGGFCKYLPTNFTKIKQTIEYGSRGKP